MKGILTYAAGVLLILAAIPANAQELELQVSADSVTVGERFLLSITARHEFAAAPEFPPADTAAGSTFGDLEVLGTHARETISRDAERIDSVVYVVTTFALDTARIAPIPVVFTAGEDTFTVRTEPAWVPVVSLVPDDAEDIRDLAPLVEFPAPLWPYAAAAAALLLLAAALALYLQRRRDRETDRAPAPPPPVAADREALDRLAALERVDLTDPTKVQPFYDELSGVLRSYASRRLHVHALEMTTNEFVRELRQRDIPDEGTTNRLRDVLVASDYVKFADAAPPASQGRELISTSRNIIHAVEDRLRARTADCTDVPTV